MLKYRYLFKEYSIRYLLLSITLLLLMFLQFGFKKRTDSLYVSFLLMIPNVFTSVQFFIGMLLFDNFKRSKMETIRIKHVFLSYFEKLFITILMAILIRFTACCLYSIIIYHNFSKFSFVFRIIICDLCNVIMCYTLFNFFKNRYVALTISLVFSMTLYLLKCLHYDIIRINNDVFCNISFIPFVCIFIYLILFVVSILWKNEYVNE